MSLQDWLGVATSATPRPIHARPVAIVATVARGEDSGSVCDTPEDCCLDYTAADLTEFDALIRRYCQILGHPATKREDLLAARRRMRPGAVARELAEFRELVGELDRTLQANGSTNDIEGKPCAFEGTP